jgi:hypothetical protein
VFTPVLAKHAKSFSLIDCISAGVDRVQRNFEPMRKQVEKWQQSELTDVTAKIVIYEAFVEGRLEAPKHLARRRNDVSSLTRHATRSRSDSRSWRRRAPHLARTRNRVRVVLELLYFWTAVLMDNNCLYDLSPRTIRKQSLVKLS